MMLVTIRRAHRPPWPTIGDCDFGVTGLHRARQSRSGTPTNALACEVAGARSKSNRPRASKPGTSGNWGSWSGV